MEDIFSYEMQFLAFERKPYIKKRKVENPICLSYKFRTPSLHVKCTQTFATIGDDGIPQAP